MKTVTLNEDEWGELILGLLLLSDKNEADAKILEKLLGVDTIKIKRNE